VRPQRLRDLHRKRANTAARAVDEDALSGPHLAVVAQALQGSQCRDADCAGLDEREPRGLRQEAALGAGRVLRPRACPHAEDLIARPQVRDVLAYGLDHSGDVHAADGARPRLAEQLPDHADDQRTVHHVVIGCVHRSCVYSHEHTIVGDGRRAYFPKVQHVGRSGALLDHRLHPVGGPRCEGDHLRSSGASVVRSVARICESVVNALLFGSRPSKIGSDRAAALSPSSTSGPQRRRG
jgi:hypothetical protein